MSTQWRAGMAGYTGLDYTALPVVERRLGLPKRERAAVFDDLQRMEVAALAAMKTR